MEGAVNLVEISAGARGAGALWTLREGRDLNANLIRFSRGEGVGEHVNEEMDVLFIGVSGSGTVEVDGREHALGAGILILAPRGAQRATRSASSDLSYLTVHERRGPVRLGAGERGPGAEPRPVPTRPRTTTQAAVQGPFRAAAWWRMWSSMKVEIK